MPATAVRRARSFPALRSSRACRGECPSGRAAAGRHSAPAGVPTPTRVPARHLLAAASGPKGRLGFGDKIAAYAAAAYPAPDGTGKLMPRLGCQGIWLIMQDF